jgi:alkylhydroperoxidase/carboxymuconolactone decarboxylase family protein YurZ
MPEDPLATMRKLDPALMKHLHDTNNFIYTDGALPKKIKLLIAMAFDAAAGAQGGEAMKEGATKEEIAETIRVAYQLTGVGSVYAASAALKDLLG